MSQPNPVVGSFPPGSGVVASMGPPVSSGSASGGRRGRSWIAVGFGLAAVGLLSALTVAGGLAVYFWWGAARDGAMGATETEPGAAPAGAVELSEPGASGLAASADSAPAGGEPPPGGVEGDGGASAAQTSAGSEALEAAGRTASKKAVAATKPAAESDAGATTAAASASGESKEPVPPAAKPVVATPPPPASASSSPATGIKSTGPKPRKPRGGGPRGPRRRDGE
jgi:hypothetical protein